MDRRPRQGDSGAALHDVRAVAEGPNAIASGNVSAASPKTREEVSHSGDIDPGQALTDGEA